MVRKNFSANNVHLFWARSSEPLSSFLYFTLDRAYLVQDHTRRLILHTVCDCTFCETPNISLLWSEIFKIALRINFVGKDEDILFSLLPLSEFVSEAPPVDKSLDWIFHRKLFNFEKVNSFESFNALKVKCFHESQCFQKTIKGIFKLLC